MTKSVTERAVIRVADEFATTPGPRSPDEGDFSGENFLNQVLGPRFELALKTSSRLYVDLDGGEGYATSFLEAAFGGLARKYGAETVLSHLDLKSDDEPYLVDEIFKYIREAERT